MVGRHVALLRLVVGHQREIDHPEELPVVGPDRELAALLQQRRRLEPDAAEDRAGLLPGRRRKEDHVAVRDPERGGQRGLLGLGEELDDGRLPFAALDLDEGEALRAEALRDLLEGLQLALGQVGEALGVEGLDDAARRRRWPGTP